MFGGFTEDAIRTQKGDNNMSSRNESGTRSRNKRATTKQGKRAKALHSGKKLEPQRPLKVDAYLQIPDGPSGGG